MDQQSLWLGVSFAAPKLAGALWCTQLALLLLDRRARTLGWQILLALATIAASWQSFPIKYVPDWWQAVWVINSILAAAALLNCLRCWLNTTERDVGMETIDKGNARADRKGADLKGRLGTAHWVIAIIGLAIASSATSSAIDLTLSKSTWFWRVHACAYYLTIAGMLGLALASSLELTFGATGENLMRLAWRRLWWFATAVWMVHLVLSSQIALYHRLAATSDPSLSSSVETIAPFVFTFGMTVVGYIVWAVFQRMVTLGSQGKVSVDSHVSLALSSWLAVLCLTVACGLPPSWPWASM